MAVEEFRFVWKKRCFRIGVSIGLVAITKSSGSVANVLGAADKACYAAKHDGHNHVNVFQFDDINLVPRQGEMRWAAQPD